MGLKWISDTFNGKNNDVKAEIMDFSLNKSPFNKNLPAIQHEGRQFVNADKKYCIDKTNGKSLSNVF